MTESQPSVLVVEDNCAVADTYASFLEAEYDVTVAYTGSAALDALSPAVDVVLLDRRLPDVSGDEILTRIDQRALDARVVMVTAVEPSFDVIDMPVDEYVVKPVDRPELLAVVAEMVERSGYDDAFRRFLALASKKATLERRKTGAELSTSEEYERVRDRLAERRESLSIATERVEEIFTGDAPDIVASDRA